MTAAPLLQLLSASLARGHWRVACQRYLMMRAAGLAVPHAAGQQCEAYLAKCSEREHAAMQVRAAQWARMVGVSAAPARSETAPAGDVASQPPAVRTIWQRPSPYASTQPA